MLKLVDGGTVNVVTGRSVDICNINTGLSSCSQRVESMSWKGAGYLDKTTHVVCPDAVALDSSYRPIILSSLHGAKSNMRCLG